jgi:hypothetical protein
MSKPQANSSFAAEGRRARTIFDGAQIGACEAWRKKYLQETFLTDVNKKC